MNTRVKTTDYTMTPATADYLDQKLKALQKFLDEEKGEALCEVEIGRAAGHPERGNIWRAEVNIVSGGRDYRAEAQAETVNAAIDEVKDEITRQFRKDKRFHIRLVRRGGALLKRLMRFGRAE